MPTFVHRKNVLLGCATMLISTLLFGVMHATVRHLSAELHPFEVAFFRNALALLFFIPLVIRGSGDLLKTDHFKWHLLRATINVGAMLMFFYALAITPLAIVQALSFTAPLFTTLLAVFFLKERVRLRRCTAIAIGFSGVLIILRPGIQPIELGTLLVLGSASLWALTMIVIKRLSDTDSATTITAYATIFLTFMSLIPALLVWKTPIGSQWGWLMLAAICGTLGQFCIAKAFAFADATTVLPFDFAKIIWGASLGYLFFGEYVDAYTWIGAVVIFSGACYVAIRERQLEKEQLRATHADAENAKPAI